ncbi:MAG TPA: hypothetical protein DCZ95_12470 [Verrucomicrobia bacterium]|nr:hypothetical protein [Verrucomicrobiota bacterium]
MQFDSWRIFHVAKKVLPKGILQQIYTRSARLIDSWSADPRFCEVTARNPLDRMKILFAELSMAGRDAEVIAALDWLSEVVDRRTERLGQECSDKKSVDGEVADLAVAMGDLAAQVRYAMADGQVDSAESIRIKKAAMELAKEADQLLDAAGVRR